MDIKERIKSARKAAFLSQSQLAQLLGLSFMTVRRWESGEISPRINEIQQISKALHTPIEYLIGISDNPHFASTDVNSQKIMALAQKLCEEDIDLKEPISAGISDDKITVHDGNSNLTLSFPNNEEGRKTLAFFLKCSQGQANSIFANSISGDNNSGNNLGVIQEKE